MRLQQGCDVMVATGLFSSVVAARSVADKLGMRYVFAAYCPIFLPSPYRRPFEYPSHPHPAGVTDNQVLWDRDVQVMNELFGDGLNTLRAVGRFAEGRQRARLLPHRSAVARRGSCDRTLAAAGKDRCRADRRVDPAGRAAASGRSPGVPRRRFAACLRGLRQSAGAEGLRQNRGRCRACARPPRSHLARLGGARTGG